MEGGRGRRVGELGEEGEWGMERERRREEEGSRMKRMKG